MLKSYSFEKYDFFWTYSKFMKKIESFPYFIYYLKFYPHIYYVGNNLHETIQNQQQICIQWAYM